MAEGFLRSVRRALAARVADPSDAEAVTRQHAALALVDEAQRDADLLQSLTGEQEPDEEQEAVLLLTHARARLQAAALAPGGRR